MTQRAHSSSWHQDWFDRDYLRLYGHRGEGEAADFLAALRRAGLLESPRAGGWLLDLGCGAGRHSLALAALGYRVLGLDWSDALLAEARRQSPAPGNPCWIRADLARPPLAGGADVVLSLFTSLGYQEADEANAAAWARALALVRPGGRVVLDFLNPSAVREGLVARSERRAGDWRVREERRIDEGAGMVEKVLRFGPPGEPPRRVVERVKLYGPQWFLARAAGWRTLAHWGDLRGGAFAAGSPRSVLVLERPC